MVTMTSRADDAPSLLSLAAQGDEAAFARIVDAHHADMSSVCFVVTGGDAELTAEAVQSAWPIAWRKLDTLRDPERLRPWLISIAVNEARQLSRAGLQCPPDERQREASARPQPPPPHFGGAA